MQTHSRGQLFSVRGTTQLAEQREQPRPGRLREGVSRFGGCIHGLQFCEAGLGKRGIPSSTSEWATRSPGG
jgi:hypothetical protein